MRDLENGLSLIPLSSLDISIEQLREIMEKRDAHGEIAMAAFDGVSIVGLVCATINHKLNGAKVAFIEDLFVLPDYRNRNIGSSLMRHLLVRLHEIGCHKGYGYTSIHNDVVAKIHKSLGAKTLEDHCWVFKPRKVLQE